MCVDSRQITTGDKKRAYEALALIIHAMHNI